MSYHTMGWGYGDGGGSGDRGIGEGGISTKVWQGDR